MPATPIGVPEFLQLLQKCKRPRGWRKGGIAVANSGGPDSMCLLYLLHQTVKTYGTHGGLPQNVYSIHVNHNLRPRNRQMASQVSKAAGALGVPHFEYLVDWGSRPFPPKPLPGKPFEAIARDARMYCLQQSLLHLPAHNIAFAHHADDQVETVIMRLMHGSGILGAGGMRHAHLWGMGNNNNPALTFRGLAGMRTTVIRPLLDVPKARIYATCEANGIKYITDETNFQPDVAMRNYIRHHLATRDASSKEAAGSGRPLVEPEATSNVASDPTEPRHDSNSTTSQKREVEDAIQKLQSMAMTTDLREAVRQTAEVRERLESRADALLRASRLPSPSGTFLIAPLLRRDNEPLAVRIALLRRILRYISPQPWGSIAAEAYGREASLRTAVERIWNVTVGADAEGRQPFSIGGKVLWSPVAVDQYGTIRKRPWLRHDEQAAWVAYRAPPAANEPNTLETHIDPVELKYSSSVIDVLYDNRYRIKINPNELPRTDVELTIVPSRAWLQPCVTWREGSEQYVYAKFSDFRASDSVKRDGVSMGWIRHFRGDK